MTAVRTPGRNALVVGAGVQGLLAALALRDRGHAVRVHSAGADPRTGGDTRSGTSGGESARLITLLEGCPYVGHAADSPEISGVFERPVSQGGWLGTLRRESNRFQYRDADEIEDSGQSGGLSSPSNAIDAAAGAAGRSRTKGPLASATDPRLPPRRPDSSGADTRHDEREETAWLAARQAAWLDRGRVARTLADCVATARRSMALWQRLHADRPALFAGCDWHDAGVLRLFDDAATLAAAESTHRDLGVLDDTLTPAGLVRRFPLYARAADDGFVAGGLLVRGFAVAIRRFVRNLIDALEHDGVAFAWHDECLGPVETGDGRVSGLRFARGVERADDYVLAPGAYGGALLRAFGVRASGLAGRWLLVPTPAGFSVPTKLHLGPRHDADGDRPVLDLNLMTYFDAARQRQTIAVGGGYLHVGEYPFRHDPAELRRVDADIERAVRRLMPDAGPVERSDAMCVRSLAVDDRPIRLVRDTDRDGRLVLHTGLNTGTTAMAPAVAEWIVTRLNRDI